MQSRPCQTSNGLSPVISLADLMAAWSLRCVAWTMTIGCPDESTRFRIRACRPPVPEGLISRPIFERVKAEIVAAALSHRSSPTRLPAAIIMSFS